MKQKAKLSSLNFHTNRVNIVVDIVDIYLSTINNNK